MRQLTMHGPRESRRLPATALALLAVTVAAGVLVAARGWRAPRSAATPSSSGASAAVAHRTAAAAPPAIGSASGDAAPARTGSLPPAGSPQQTGSRPPAAAGPLAALPEAEAHSTAAALLADAAAARRQGDLRTTLALLRAAAERVPSVETHAALGGLYLELGAVGRAETNLRAALEGDPGNADRWIALANALALKPDPMAAADALERARAAEPGVRITRGDDGWLAREPAS